jgi:hypothetical protein
MDGGRKSALLIVASILAALKLAQFEAGRRVPAMIERDCGRRAMGGRDYEGD